MKVEEFEKEFLSMSEADQMQVLGKILPVFCRNKMQDSKKIQEMFTLFTKECGESMGTMTYLMGKMMGRQGGGCCG